MTAALIVAAGRGSRLGADIPKQYLDLGGKSVLFRTIEAFLGLPDIARVQVVINPDDGTLFEEATKGLDDPRLAKPVPGGETRARSVSNGLQALVGTAPQKVLIHDAARPFVTTRIIRDVIEALDTAEGAFSALEVVDALWRADEDHAATPVPRTNLWRAQTPQGFHFDRILDAHRASDGTAADDVAVAREAGIEVRLIPGDESNFKITTRHDLDRARALVT